MMFKKSKNQGMKLSHYIVGVSLLAVAFAGCKKYETLPAEAITEEYIFDHFDRNGVLAQQLVNNIYTHLNRGFNRIDGVVLDAATDDAIASENANAIEVLSKGMLTVTNNIDDTWASSYACIRKVNNFLSKEAIVPRDSATKQYWRAEVRFMRAYSYFELIKRYGGVPLIGNRVIGLNEPIDMPRNTFAECVNYIVSEVDAIKDSLRKETSGTEFPATEWGKVTRGTALALKSRVLLYAASPLNNPANDITKWQAAADAAKAVMNLNYYSLHANFVNLFTTRSNREIILAYQRANTNDLERLNAPVGYAEPNLGMGLVSPTQELADAFPTRTGLVITDAASGYDLNAPYVNRDPRMNATLFYNGSRWLSRDVETFDGGLDKPGGIQIQTRTGYYMRKFLADMSNATAYSAQVHNFPIFRYAEILLNYAEAINETGNQTEAFNQLKAIRLRAGIPVGTTAGLQHGLKTTMNQAEMREAIRTERRIELAFEEHRFWDIRRWKIAEAVSNREVHGMRAVKTGTNTFTYTPFVADRIYFNPAKHYLYPIPFIEVVSNPEMVQNPGY
jgi:starch-binding outer membrane protein, SusD/RagB family